MGNDKPQIWPGSSSFDEVPNPTPFNFYDDDIEFSIDADKFASFAARRLGYPISDVELIDINFYAAFEEAITMYGNEVFAFKMRDNYLSLEGLESGSIMNDSIVIPNLNDIINISKQYGTEAGTGGSVTWHKGHVWTVPMQQEYDLAEWAEEEGIEGGIEIRRIYHQGPPALMRYFDPHGGIGMGYQGMMSNFGWGSYSPAINFLLMPLSFDVQRLQAIEFNDEIRRSSFSFELIDNKLKILPIPREEQRFWFDYIKLEEKRANAIKPSSDKINHLLNVPYQNPEYSQINSIGRKWIFDYALALAKEMLGYVRGKYTTVPIPNQEVTLNHATLVSAAEAEKIALLERLREFLDQMSRRSLLERRRDESQFGLEEISRVPMPIWIA